MVFDILYIIWFYNVVCLVPTDGITLLSTDAFTTTVIS